MALDLPPPTYIHDRLALDSFLSNQGQTCDDCLVRAKSFSVHDFDTHSADLPWYAVRTATVVPATWVPWPF